MYNLQYHLTSLVAVFLALTIGLVLGTVVAERGALDAQSETIVADLQARFEEMQAEDAATRTELDRATAFVADAAPALVTGRLEGDTIAIIVHAGRSDGLTSLIDTLKQAGATPLVYRIESEGFGLAESVPEGLPELLGMSDADFAGLATDSRDEVVAERLAQEWRAAGGGPVTDLLLREGLLTGDLPDGPAPVTGCVHMASFSGEPDAVAARIAEAFADAGLPALGAEATTQETGVAVDAVERDLSAVSHLETPQGDVSVVWVLSGDAEGYFGFSDDADAAYPALEQVPGQ